MAEIDSKDEGIEHLKVRNNIVYACDVIVQIVSNFVFLFSHCYRPLKVI